MSSQVFKIALRIALLKEEFSEEQILQAVKLLEEQGMGSALLEHLRGSKRKTSTPTRVTRKGKSFEEQRSKAVIALQQKDPEKFRVLCEFDSLLRKASVLPEADDIKRLGAILSKSFAVTKSRRESISKLMSLLAERPLDEIREIVRTALLTSKVDKNDTDYQQLAQFIITGRKAQTDTDQRVPT